MGSTIKIGVANAQHCFYAKQICDEIEASAKARKTGIAKREVAYIQKKMRDGQAIIAIDEDNKEIAGFCYIESWENKNFVSNSGLIVFPNYRALNYARQIKKAAFELARERYPGARLFGLTTNSGVMKINNELGYRPVSYTTLTKDQTFWKGCSSCVNYAILQAKDYQNCLCTAMIFDPKQNQKEQKVKLLLAFSGGLDTSYCVKYLAQELNYEVHTLTVNTGGFDKDELQMIQQRALTLGVASHQNIDATTEFYQRCVKYLIFGNVLKNNTYPLCVSAERAFQALTIAKVAKAMDIKVIAHGSTGAGNDQVRFDMMLNILIPGVEIITPIRDQKLSRQASQDFLKQHGISCSDQTKNYSINKGLWGRRLVVRKP
ncbi:MAG: GNAT family N-acetyltransferase [Francisellaceae bacterium]